ncbi:hypothetical protein Desaci_0046 [Desulfosporosinus acidiphilus SJ4]|uniref:Uncharacterized protein n=1 Tax=Desulfosporosinus acidiphilus (strain DSM 22704 / JCM 16185 / SJ4) TaxID=646529 RepID=I4D037_DESAJ|nr:hypothetical protein [Desulfosporosinus acidiphilus]AFM39161.1 hypothetical protein Desaci_0046 [Desulfosporosinus acidiphilus SJ4]
MKAILIGIGGVIKLSKENNQRLMRWSNIIATLATTVLAVTALITVYLTVAAWKVQQETTRPYFVLKESPQVVMGNELSLELKFNNVGVHPAVNLSSETIVFDGNLSGEPVHHDESAIVNEIPKDALSSLLMTLPNNKADYQQCDITPHYVVVDLQYGDPILNKSYNQTIYMKWNGIEKGKIQPTVHVNVSEKAKILQYFKTHGIDIKGRS